MPLRIAKSAHEHTGTAETLRPSLRNGFTAYFALFPENGSSVAHEKLSLFLDLSIFGMWPTLTNSFEDHTLMDNEPPIKFAELFPRCR